LKRLPATDEEGGREELPTNLLGSESYLKRLPIFLFGEEGADESCRKLN
jgi:hypothetical protein